MFDLKVGYSCNNKCIHCVVENKKSCRDLTKDEIVQLLEEYKDQDITFTGGEPTIRTDFNFLCGEAKRINPQRKIYLQTNGRWLKDEDLAKELCRFVDMFLIAVHSNNSQIHDTITQIKGSFEDTIKGIYNIYKIDPQKINTQTVLSQLNCYTIYDTYAELQSAFPKIHRMNLTYPHLNGAALTNVSTVAFPYTTIKDKLLKCAKDFGPKLAVEAIPRCIFYPYENEMTYSEIREDVAGIDLANSQNGSKFFKNGIIDSYSNALRSEKRKLDSCALCKYNNKCDGIWKEYFYIFQNNLANELIPVK